MEEGQFHHAVLREEGGGFVAVGDDGEEVEQKCLGVGHRALSSKTRASLRGAHIRLLYRRPLASGVEI
jgi:hypothetical protein